MGNNILTCLDCKDRHPGCHGKCEKYQKEKALRKKQKEHLNADRDFLAYKRIVNDRRTAIIISRRKHHQSCK